MVKIEGRDVIYVAAERFLEAALRGDGSLFTPGKSVWSLEHIDDFYQRFVLKEDLSGDPFEKKLQRQLDGADSLTIQFVAELLFGYLLLPADMGVDKKRGLIQKVLSRMAVPVEIPAELDSALATGIASFGTAHNQRFYHLRFFLEFLRIWKQMRDEDRANVLQDPWRFKAAIFTVPGPAAHVQREGLLHLVFPDVFESIISSTHKQRIVKRFGYLTEDPSGDIDRVLRQIRQELEPNYGDGFSFYSPLIRPAWDSTADLWDLFVYWAACFHRSSDFDAQERDYKLVVAERAREARDTFLSGTPNWRDLLKRAFQQPNNLTNWRVHSAFLKWCEAKPEPATQALGSIWQTDTSLEERVNGFLQLLPREVASGTSNRLGIASFLLLADDPSRYAIYRTTPYEQGYKLTGYPAPGSSTSEVDQYGHALAFLDEIIEQAAKRDLRLRDRLDAQSVLWSIFNWDTARWPEAEKRALSEYRQGLRETEFQTEEDEDFEPPHADPAPEQSNIEDLADRLLINGAYLKRIEQLLSAKGQVVFYGPPGTGKTYVATELATFFTRSGGSVEIVQFHPSYAYEDFVEGYRPREVNGQPGFRLIPGPLKRITEQAIQHPNALHVLIIDEINRGNVARVLGELYFLLEYRDHEISLQYSAESFRLPKNLWIIATMNTADRSIALVDAALRRRFFFVPFFPDQPPIRGLLQRWLQRHHPGMQWVADMVDRANQSLADRHAGIGPSYFMRNNLSDDWVELIWEHQILPYLEEHFLGEEDRLDDFDLDRLRQAGNGQDGADEAILDLSHAALPSQ